MKREGRQHGLVRTYPIITSLWNVPTPNSRYCYHLNSLPTVGLFTEASPKPWNHSMFTGKCGRSKCTMCLLQPSRKAKDKAKGKKKLRGYDIVTNYRLMTWRVTDTRPRLTFSGSSATSILDHLVADHMDVDDVDGFYHDADEHKCDI
ncbi:uncharacterized protein LOC129875268 [Solanum dulcamara]|uniref:uncharacterized protein LOC129875268 n=1 Tax=Solanum dulcamara TaxID=45834 RepID=UPI00248567E0|nr:uncharacterized protein LOC129875268 [Solanum dulcamara]